MKRLALVIALVCCSCQRASFSGETFYCDETAQCADGYFCVRNTCVTDPDAGVEVIDAGQCSAFDGGRGDCVSDVFCGTLRTCEATCTATVYDDFD
ncbi:MAG: hypothetical protein JNK82_31775, partial [Myxococcaceae bacterium]|nr:hypothetical protein [Myxococcaceae bacterium]